MMSGLNKIRKPDLGTATTRGQRQTNGKRTIINNLATTVIDVYVALKAWPNTGIV